MTKAGTATPTTKRATLRPAGPPAGNRSTSTTFIAAAGLAWLALILGSGRFTLHGSTGDVALSTAVTSLPALVTASLFAGAAVSYAITINLVRATTRTVLGVLAGVVTGGVAVGVVLLAFGMSAKAATAVAVAVGIAGAIGGALGTTRPARTVAAGLLATLPVIVLQVVFNHYSDQLLRLFGAGADASISARFAAGGWVALVTSLIEGLLGGLVVFAVLRRSGLRWPMYVLGGLAPGLLLGASWVITRITGPQILALASAQSPLDQTFTTWADNSRLNSTIVVFFVGALTAMVAHGRTLDKNPAS